MKKREPDFLSKLCDVMEEPDAETAATALQRRYEAAVAKDPDLHRLACFGKGLISKFGCFQRIQ